MTRLFKTFSAASFLALSAAVPTLAQEVNIYTTREPGLIQPILDAFTADTGVTVNTVFLQDGLIERVSAEGESSPADILMTVDFGALIDLVDAGLTQPVDSEVLDAAVPEALRDAEGNWFALSGRARVLYAAKDLDLGSFTYEQLDDEEWRGGCASVRVSTPTTPQCLQPTWRNMAKRKPAAGSKASRPIRLALPPVATAMARATLPRAFATSPWPTPIITA